MVYFTTAIDKYFAGWILTDTWYTGHWADEERFYMFVKAVDKYSRALKSKARNPRTCDEKAMREKILLFVQRNYPRFDKTYAEDLAREYAGKAILILEYSWCIRHSSFGSSTIRDWSPPFL